MPIGEKISSKPQNTNLSEDKKQSELKKYNFNLEDPKHTLKDLILPNHTLDSIEDALCMYKNKNLIFNDWGLGGKNKLENKLGINLYGPPGTGKTISAHAIANMLNRKIICVNYSEIESKYVGETSKNLEKLFSFAKENNAIIFFDEADAMLSKRVTNMSNSTDVSVNQTRSVLLVLLNNHNDIVIFATNFINNIDEAFMRRIQFHIKFELPDYEERKKLWNLNIPSTMPNDADIEFLAKNFDNVSGSDISNAVLLAAFKGARLNPDRVRNEFFIEAIQNIVQSKLDNKDSKNIFN